MAIVMFEWDEGKRAANLVKHGIDFMQIGKFEWETAFKGLDERQDYGELRERAIGYIDRRLHVVIFTQRNEVQRIITLRKANARERKLYVQETKA